MKFNTIFFESDLLIIGGGCAGSMAAISAKEMDPSLNVTVFEKGHIKRSGSVTMGMDALNVAVIPGLASPQEYTRMVKEKCFGIFDEEINFVLAEKSFEILKLLEDWGVFFPKNDNGDYSVLKVDPQGEFAVLMDEPDLKLILEKKVRTSGVKVFNKTMGVKLLVLDNKIVGAIGLNIATGSVMLCKAKSIILANGSVGRFGLPNTGYLYGTFDFPGNAGDGFALAFRAGAKLTGMEYTLRYPLIKDLNTPLLNIVMTKGARIIDSLGNLIMDGNNYCLYDLIDRVSLGGGPLYIKTSHLSKDKIFEMENVLFSTERPLLRRYLEMRKIKLGEDLLELGLTEAQLCGGHGLSGIVINKYAETNIDGLFASGDVSSVPFQHLTGAFVYGKIAAKSAVNYCISQHFSVPDAFFNEALKLEIEKFNRFFEHNSYRVDHNLLEFKLRRIINEYLLSPKNSVSLNNGIRLIRELRDELPGKVRVDNYHQLGKVLELQYLLDCAQMSAVASLTRKESRWGSIHRRIDFPNTDDKRWLKHIDLQIGESYPEIKVCLREIKRVSN